MNTKRIKETHIVRYRNGDEDKTDSNKRPTYNRKQDGYHTIARIYHTMFMAKEVGNQQVTVIVIDVVLRSQT